MTRDEAKEILINHNEWRKDTFPQKDVITTAIDVAIQALSDGWVSVEEDLPPNESAVMVSDGQIPSFAYYDSFYEDEPPWVNIDGTPLGEYEVKYWRYAPSSPKPNP